MITTTSLYATEAAKSKRTPIYRIKFTSAYRNSILADTPNAFWRFNGDFTDSTLNQFNGSPISGPFTFVPGAIVRDSNTGLLMNGAQYVQLGNNSATHPGDVFTIEAWVRLLSITQIHVVIDSQANNDYKFWIDANAKLNLDKRGSSTIVTSTVAIPLNAWTHVAVTKNGSNVHLYLNGQDVTGTVTNATIVVGSAQPNIGYDGTHFTYGAMDEVAIYPTALSATRIASHYDAAIFHLVQEYATQPIKTNYADEILGDAPVGYWRFGESSNASPAADSSNCGMAGAYQNSPVVNVAGALTGDSNTAVTLNGTTQYISVPNASPLSLLADVFTLEAWVNPSAFSAALAIVSNGTNGYLLTLTASTGLLALTKEGGSTICTSTVAVSTGVWTHVVATKNGSSVHLYINGVDVSGAVSNQTCTTTASALNIGRRVSSTDLFFNGSLDEVSLYSAALSPARIQAHYNAGLMRFNRGMVSPYLAGVKWGASQAIPERGQISIGSMTFTLNDVADYVSEVMADVPNAFWPLGELNGNAATDISGNTLTGVYQASPQLGQAGPFTAYGSLAQSPDWAPLLNGTSQYVLMPANTLLHPGDVFTLEAWVNLNSFSGSPMIINTLTGNDYQLEIDATGHLVLLKTAVSTIVTSTSTISLNTWAHIVATKNGSTVHLYINGVDVTGVVTNATIVASSTAIQIGTNNGSQWASGSIADVAIYPTALSIDRVTAHYQAALTRRQGPNGAITGMIASNFVSQSVSPPNISIEGQPATFSQGFDLITEGNYIQLPAGLVDSYVLTQGLTAYQFTMRDTSTLLNVLIFIPGITQLTSSMAPGDVGLPLADIGAIQNVAFTYGLYVQIDNEIIQYSNFQAASGPGTLSITARGALGTTAASHANNATVTEIFHLGPDHPATIIKILWENKYKEGCGIDPSLLDIVGLTNIRNGGSTLRTTDQIEMVITSAQNAKSFLEQQLYQMLGFFPTTSSGLYSITAIASLGSSVDSITHDNIVVDTSGNPQMSWDRNFRQGPIINYMLWNYDAGFLNGVTTNSYKVKNDASITRFGQQSETLNSLGLHSNLPGTIAMMSGCGNNVIARYNNALPLLSVRVFLIKNLLEPGDVVAVTSALLPNRSSKTLGITSVLMQVYSRAIDFQNGYVDLVLAWPGW